MTEFQFPRESNNPVLLNGINVAVSTISREESYLPATLDSLFQEHPVNVTQPVSLVVGSPETAYLDPLRSRPGLTVIEMGPTTWAWMKNSSVRYRATWNYYRCLTQCAAGERGTLVLEDDVRFARGWRERLERTLIVLEAQHGSGFVLTLYAARRYGRGGNCLSAEYPLPEFFGTQGVYYPAKTAQGFAKYLKRHGLVSNQEPYDHLLRDYLLREGQPLFVCTPSLIQHIGRRSTGLGGWHESPDFVEDVTTLDCVHA